MKQFAGFPARMHFTYLPNLFFSSLLPQISDITELKTTLHVFKVLYHKRGYPRFVTYGELLGDKSLVSSLGETAKPSDQALRNALEMATQRGTILHIVLDRDGITEDIYLLNTERNRDIVAKIQNGEFDLPVWQTARLSFVAATERPDIFTLYEQNIGMLTPMIADELLQAEKLYPVIWIEDAIREVVSLNKRSWRYIARILENWSSEGKRDGTHRRDSGPKTDKYVKQKYGHMVKR